MSSFNRSVIHLVCPHTSKVGNRRIVLHADDFGMNQAVTAGIIEGFTDGLLTSTSVLANSPYCSRALSAWKELGARQAAGALPSAATRSLLGDVGLPFDLGIHLNLTQGAPLTGDKFPAELLKRDGLFSGVWNLAKRLCFGGSKYRLAIQHELKSQIEFLIDHGISPTHLNGHQYVEMLPVVSSIVPELMRRYAIRVARVPVEPALSRTLLLSRFEPANWGLAQIKLLFARRHHKVIRRSRMLQPQCYFGTSHAGRIDLANMLEFIHAAGDGIAEIGMHPGCTVVASPDPVSPGWEDPLAGQRPHELELLQSPELALLFEMHQATLGRLAELNFSHSSAVAA